MDVLQNPIPLVLMPYLHFLALKTLKNSVAATLPFLLFCFTVPLARGEDGSGCNPYLMGLFLGLGLRIMDCATIPSKSFSRLQYRDYLVFLVAFKNPIKSKSTTDIPIEKQNAAYYRTLILRLIPKFILYFTIIKYFRKYRTDLNPQPMQIFDMNDPWSICNAYLLGWALCMLMDVIVTIFVHLISFTLKTPYIPIMNQPYLATSVRDFWSNRWNLVVQRGLKSSVFEPTLRLLGSNPDTKKRIPHLHLIIAGLVTFVFSAVMHEWTLLVLLQQPSTKEQLVFFILHGVWTVLEVSVRKLVLKYAKIDLTLMIPIPIQIVYVHIILLLTGPLFMNPYIREQLYFKVGFA